jgi:DNA polymerase-3 subunit alpha
VSGITDIDPLPYGLLFERFLNPARISMPDIDVDFADDDRDKVLEYVRLKYGADRVAQICTFGTMAARAAVKDAGKALGIPFSEMNLLASYIPSRPGTKLIDALQESIEFKQAYEGDARYKKVIDQALKLEGTVRQLGVHACAVIIAPEPITNYCALQHPPKDTATIVTQLSQYPLEELGLLKMDFLGLRNLTIMKRCLRIVRDHHGIDVDLLKLDMEDKKVFKVFADGDTTGVFQFESAGMRKYLRELKPNVFEDIIVMVSLYRPGPMAYIPTYIARKSGKENVSYPHPSLEAILRPTQGIAVYQEQIMQLVQAFAGFSLGEADILRRAIGKKKIDLLMEQKEKFIKAANSQGHSTDLAKYIFEDIIEPFAGYGFNKSHAACYALISYQTAYLKAYFPAEFMTALMISDEDDMERITMEIDECTSKEIEILPPDINESHKHFTFIDKQNIRFGLKAIKGLGDGPIETIRKGREAKPYGNLLELMAQTAGDVVNKKSLEALILSGALDRFGERGSLLKSMGTMISYTKELEAKKQSSQIGLFDMGSSGDHDFSHLQFSLEKAPAMSYEEKITGEKLSIGYSVSGHGLDGLGPFIERRTIGKDTALQFLKDFELAEQTRSHEIPAEGGEMPTDGEPGSDAPPAPAAVPAPEPKKPAPLPVADDVEKPKSKEREKLVRVRYIGYVQSVRKIQTKTGKLMCVALCDGIHFRFSIVIFPKDYEALGNLLQDNLIAVVEGNLKCNEENGEISVIAQTLKTFSITTLRTQAMEMGLFSASHKVRKKLATPESPAVKADVKPIVLNIPK